MAVDARTEKFQHLKLFDKYALFTNDRIDRATIPEGWYCYDFRGSDSDLGKLNCVEPHVGVCCLPIICGNGWKSPRGGWLWQHTVLTPQ